MIQKGDGVLAAVSGGPDSVALVYALEELSADLSFRLGIIHLNHGLRGENADRDAAFVRKLAQEMNLPAFFDKKDVLSYRKKMKLSLEEAARQVRYDFFETVLNTTEYNKIALGHHADDNAELILMYLLRGSGTSGLSGIAPVRENRFIRPMIRTGRNEIIHFLNRHQSSWVTDETNTDTRFMRNRIRNELLPLLQSEYNPNISATINRLGHILKEDEDWIAPMVFEALTKITQEKRENKITLCLSGFNNSHNALKRRMIRMAIGSVKGNLRKITLLHTDSAISFAKSPNRNGVLDFPDRIRVVKKPSRLTIQKEEKPLRLLGKSNGSEVLSFRKTVPEITNSDSVSIHIPECGRRLQFFRQKASSGLLAEAMASGEDTAFLDMDLLQFPLTVRNYEPGDRFIPLGMSKSQKLKKFFSNKKVSLEARHKTPILLSGDRIIWVAGYRMADSCRITPGSQNILKIKLLLA